MTEHSLPLPSSPEANRLYVLERTLQWIADETYAGNYPAEIVVDIYRKWARHALRLPFDQLEPSDYSEPGL